MIEGQQVNEGQRNKRESFASPTVMFFEIAARQRTVSESSCVGLPWGK